MKRHKQNNYLFEMNHAIIASLKRILAPHYFVMVLFAALTFASCDHSYTPKPRGYFKIIFPQKGMQHFDGGGCPFEFDYPTYGMLNRDSVFLDTVPDNPCWYNIVFPQLNGVLHLSYKDVDGINTLDKLIDDSHKLTFKHTVKADYIDENFISTPNHVYGIMFDVGGNAASELQFFLTDSIQHFLRGSLYFYSTPNADSIAPVMKFIRPDVLKLISSLKWK